MATAKLTAVGGQAPTNGGANTVEASQPYTATVTIEGVADILFHRWNCESVAAKSAAGDFRPTYGRFVVTEFKV